MIAVRIVKIAHMNIMIIIRLHELIETKNTGTPRDLAQKLNLSERMVYNYISFMKEELTASFIYDADKTTYCYINDCNLTSPVT